jgi:hypothetical protein
MNSTRVLIHENYEFTNYLLTFSKFSEQEFISKSEKNCKKHNCIKIPTAPDVHKIWRLQTGRTHTTSTRDRTP